MTDEQTLQTIREIMDTLHDPKTGFNGFRNELRASGIRGAEYDKKIANKIKQMGQEHGIENIDDIDFKFRMTGADIMKHRFFNSCGLAAKAFCYVNSQLPAEKRLDVKILISTYEKTLINGKEGHTIPMVRFSDGKYRAIEPQNNPNTDEYIIPDELKIGGKINHIVPPLRGKTYIIGHFLPYEFYQEKLSDFNVAINYFIHRSKKTNFIIGEIQNILSTLPQTPGNRYSARLYDFCAKLKNNKLPIDIINFGEYWALRVKLDNEYYIANINHDQVKLDNLNKVLAYENLDIAQTQTMSPREYVQYYNNIIIKSKSEERE